MIVIDEIHLGLGAERSLVPAKLDTESGSKSVALREAVDAFTGRLIRLTVAECGGSARITGKDLNADRELGHGLSLAKNPPHALYTVGHSTRTADELIAALRAWGVETLIDIRHYSRSRKNPQFNQDVLPTRLQQDGIGYLALPGLGGRRGRATTASRARNAGWQHVAFKNYADYAETLPFAEALTSLLQEMERSVCAVMCAEALWWRCHRRIVADYVMARGFSVIHIFTARKAQPAVMTPFGRVNPRTQTLRYPPPCTPVTHAVRRTRSPP